MSNNNEEVFHNDTVETDIPGKVTDIVMNEPEIEPEIVNSNSDEIVKLKELHEKMVEPLNRKLKKKRKTESNKLINHELFNSKNEDELDTSVLDYLSKNGLVHNYDVEENIKKDIVTDYTSEEDDEKALFVTSKKM